MIPFFGVMLLPIAFLIVFLMFGLLFMIFGYSMRPRQNKIITPLKPLETKTEEKPPQLPEMTEAPLTSQQAPSRPSKPQIELTRIKGIGPKRVAALNALQIMSVEDLTEFSAEELAEKLRIPSKITEKWVEQALNLLKEGS
jgi:predicted flap endonuclease-1-like 5' DNA nuclease